MTIAEINWNEQDATFLRGLTQCLSDKGLSLEVEFFEPDVGTPCFAIVTPGGECLLHGFRDADTITLLDGDGEFLKTGTNLEEMIYGVQLT